MRSILADAVTSIVLSALAFAFVFMVALTLHGLWLTAVLGWDRL